MKPIPVLIEDMIKKVNDKSTHPEQRQHYAKTLEHIIEEAQRAVNNYDRERMASFKNK